MVELTSVFKLCELAEQIPQFSGIYTFWTKLSKSGTLWSTDCSRQWAEKLWGWLWLGVPSSFTPGSCGKEGGRRAESCTGARSRQCMISLAKYISRAGCGQPIRLMSCHENNGSTASSRGHLLRRLSF